MSRTDRLILLQGIKRPEDKALQKVFFLFSEYLHHLLETNRLCLSNVLLFVLLFCLLLCKMNCSGCNHTRVMDSLVIMETFFPFS